MQHIKCQPPDHCTITCDFLNPYVTLGQVDALLKMPANWPLLHYLWFPWNLCNSGASRCTYKECQPLGHCYMIYGFPAPNVTIGQVDAIFIYVWKSVSCPSTCLASPSWQRRCFCWQWRRAAHLQQLLLVSAASPGCPGASGLQQTEGQPELAAPSEQNPCCAARGPLRLEHMHNPRKAHRHTGISEVPGRIDPRLK